MSEQHSEASLDGAGAGHHRHALGVVADLPERLSAHLGAGPGHLGRGGGHAGGWLARSLAAENSQLERRPDADSVKSLLRSDETTSGKSSTPVAHLSAQH